MFPDICNKFNFGPCITDNLRAIKFVQKRHSVSCHLRYRTKVRFYKMSVFLGMHCNV